MNSNHSPVSPRYASSPVRRTAVVVLLSLVALAVVLAYENVRPAQSVAALVDRSDTPLNQVGATLAIESMAPFPADRTSAATSAPSPAQRDPSVPPITFTPTEADAREPASPTF